VDSGGQRGVRAYIRRNVAQGKEKSSVLCQVCVSSPQ
jgi:hypothetical protein